jgi:chemotaxis protein MotB
MQPKYLQAETSNRDRWMISHMDVLTILLILFVAMTAQSLQSANSKPSPLKTTTSSFFPLPFLLTPHVSPWLPQPSPFAASPHTKSEDAQNAIFQHLRQQGLDVHLDRRGVVVNLPQSILFAPGDDRISDGAMKTVDSLAGILHDIPNQIGVVGYADATPIHNQRFRNNWELAAARGMSLLALLTDHYRIVDERLSVESHGANDPLLDNDTPAGRAGNRRVEVVIYGSADPLPR